MFPWEREVWQRKRQGHVWRVRHMNNCMIAHRLGNPHGAGLPLAFYLRQELTLSAAWRMFTVPVLP